MSEEGRYRPGSRSSCRWTTLKCYLSQAFNLSAPHWKSSGWILTQTIVVIQEAINLPLTKSYGMCPKSSRNWPKDLILPDLILLNLPFKIIVHLGTTYSTAAVCRSSTCYSNLCRVQIVSNYTTFHVEDQLQELGLQVWTNGFPRIFSWISTPKFLWSPKLKNSVVSLRMFMSCSSLVTLMVRMSVWGCGVIGGGIYSWIRFTSSWVPRSCSSGMMSSVFHHFSSCTGSPLGLYEEIILEGNQ